MVTAEKNKRDLVTICMDRCLVIAQSTKVQVRPHVCSAALGNKAVQVKKKDATMRQHATNVVENGTPALMDFKLLQR